MQNGMGHELVNIQINCEGMRAGNQKTVLISANSFNSSIILGGMLASVRGINVITGLRDQPIEDETEQYNKGKEPSKGKFDNCLVLGTVK